MVTLDSFDLMVSSKASVAIHHKRNVLGDRALLDGANGQLVELVRDPFCWRRAEDPVADMGEVEVRHGAGELLLLFLLPLLCCSVFFECPLVRETKPA